MLGAAAGRPVAATDVSDPASLANANAINPATISLAAAILGMVLIALVSVGGFSVMAQRRLRAIGMLAAQGATERHIGLVIRANGAATGVAGAVAGFVIGFARLAGVPAGRGVQRPPRDRGLPAPVDRHRRLDGARRPGGLLRRLAPGADDLPGADRGRAGRPPAHAEEGRPPGASRSGSAFLVLAFILMGLAGAAGGTAGGGGGAALQELAVGLLLLAAAVIMLAPAALGGVAWLGRGAPIAVRLALRDLSRYRARSGPALAAIALATLIAVIVCVEGAGRLSNPLDYAGPNLTASQLVISRRPAPAGAPLSPAQLARLTPGQRAKYRAQAGPGRGPRPARPRARPGPPGRSPGRSGTPGSSRSYTTSAGLTHAAGGRNWDGADLPGHASAAAPVRHQPGSGQPGRRHPHDAARPVHAVADAAPVRGGRPKARRPAR